MSMKFEKELTKINEVEGGEINELEKIPEESKLPEKEINKEEEKGNELISQLEGLKPDELTEEESIEINKGVESGEYITEEELLKKADQVNSQLDQEIIKKEIDADKYAGKKGIFMQLQKSKTFRVASKVILAYMLIFKVNSAFADNQAPDKVKDGKEVEMVVDNLGGEPDLDDTYIADAGDLDKPVSGEVQIEDFKGPELKASILDIDKYFENNEANIDEEGRVEILNHALNFFDDMADDGKMDRDKLRDFLNNEIKIKASANELSRVGGNESLSIDRGETLKNVLNSSENLNIITDKLVSLGLDEAEINQVVEKFSQAKVEIPHSETGEESGVTYITDMENPDTHENYSSDEVEDLKNNNPQEYERLLAEARSVKIDLSAEPEEKMEKIEPKEAVDLSYETVIEKLSPRLSEMANYQEILLVFDNSGSTVDDNESMTRILQDNFNSIKENSPNSQIENIKVASFDHDLGKVKSYSVEDSDKAFNYIHDQEHEGGGWEKAVDAALKMVDKADSGKKSLCYIETDELIQNVSVSEIEELEKKCSEKNIEIKFLVKPDKIISENNEGLETSNKYVELGLTELSQAVSDKIQASVDKTNKYYDNLRSTDSEQEIQAKKVERLQSFKDKQGDIKEIKLSNGITLKWY